MLAKIRKNMNQILLVMMLAFAAPAVAGVSVFAQDTTGGSTTGPGASKALDKLTGFFEEIEDVLVGKLGIALATVAVAICGVMFVFGYLDLRRLFMIVFGIVLIVSAGTIVNWIRDIS